MTMQWMTLAVTLTLLARGAEAQGIVAESGRAMVEGWAGAVAQGEPGIVASVLAPEFQLLRSTGAAHTRDSYIAGGFPAVIAPPVISDLVETGDEAIRVVRYTLVIEETVEGVTLTRRAPRLTVFRKIEDAWYVVAHANFAVAAAQE